MTVVDASVIAANLVIVVTGIGAAVAWTWTVYQFYTRAVREAARVNGELTEAVAELRAIRGALERRPIDPPSPPPPPSPTET